MKKILILCTILLISTAVFAKTKKVNIKGKKVSYVYEQDSSCVSHKETKKIVRVLDLFYQYIHDDNYDGYYSLLSTATKNEIRNEKLVKKFDRFKSYVLNLIGVIHVAWIKPLPEKFIETDQPLMCVIRLPEGQTVERRVGFDPAKRYFREQTNYIGLMIVPVETGYKIVIPW